MSWRTIITLALLLSGCAASAPRLSGVEEQKLDPSLQKLLLGTVTEPAEYDIAPGPNGERQYAVLARTEDVDQIRRAGLAVTSVAGDVAVVRVSVEQLRLLAGLSSVKRVSNGSKNRPQ
jgi:hypothetical protein